MRTLLNNPLIIYVDAGIGQDVAGGGLTSSTPLKT